MGELQLSTMLPIELTRMALMHCVEFHNVPLLGFLIEFCWIEGHQMCQPLARSWLIHQGIQERFLRVCHLSLLLELRILQHQ
ncbi:hypothetical protein DsansV1_C02g0015621 [Dioscorea sansibarensis]